MSTLRSSNFSRETKTHIHRKSQARTFTAAEPTAAKTGNKPNVPNSTDTRVLGTQSYDGIQHSDGKERATATSERIRGSRQRVLDKGGRCGKSACCRGFTLRKFEDRKSRPLLTESDRGLPWEEGGRGLAERVSTGPGPHTGRGHGNVQRSLCYSHGPASTRKVPGVTP